MAAKISALASGKIDKYEYLADLLIDRFRRHWKNTKTMEKHGQKQVQALKSLESPGKESTSLKNFVSEKKWSILKL